MANLQKDNGGGATECGDNNSEHQKKCDGYDSRQRRDGAKTCFRFRNLGHGFYICDGLTLPAAMRTT